MESFDLFEFALYLVTGVLITEYFKDYQSCWGADIFGYLMQSESCPDITSTFREYALNLCGIFNNRMGALKLPGADHDWCGVDSYWGKPT